MLYTTQDIRTRMVELGKHCKFVKVVIDGELKGILPYDDLWSLVPFEWEKPRKIRKVVLAGKTHDVRIGVNLWAATADDLWDKVLHDNLARTEKKPVKEDENPNEPLVTYDAKNGIFKIREEGKAEESQKPRATKTAKKSGLLARISRWLKGDVGYRRVAKKQKSPL